MTVACGISPRLDQDCFLSVPDFRNKYFWRS